MNTYNFDVNFTTGKIYGPDLLLVVNDHNSTTFKFTFDQEGRYVFKLLYPDNTIYVQDIVNGELVLTKGVLNQEGNYKFEISLYGDDNRLTTARIKEFPVRLELVETDEPVKADDRLPILDNLIEETNKVVEAAKNGDFDGATFTPSVSEDGDLSWSNDKGKDNPPTVNIKGPQGEPGAVKMQVVDTLPEVGETDTIYLLKKETPSEQNVYDEYIYTESTGWEHIGDTSVDLTDYYTKEETDEKLDKKQDILTAGDNITIEDNVISASGGSIPTFDIYIDKDTRFISGYPISYTSDSDVVTNFQAFIDNLNTTDSIIRVCFKSYSINDGALINCISSSQPNADLQDYIQHHTSLTYVSDVIYMSTTVNNNGLAFKVCCNASLNSSTKKISSLSINTEVLPYLPTTKTNNITVQNYAPTYDYNPATKKYVDDLISSLSSSDAIETLENQYVFVKSFDKETYPGVENLFIGGTDDSGICEYFSHVLNKMVENITGDFADYSARGMLLLHIPDGSYCMTYQRPNFVGYAHTTTYSKQYTLHLEYGLGDTGYVVSNVSMGWGNVQMETPQQDDDASNKKYVDDSIAALPSLPIYDFKMTSPFTKYNPPTTYVSMSSTDITTLQNIIQNAYDKGLESIVLIARQKYGAGTGANEATQDYLLTTTNMSRNLIKNKPSSLLFDGYNHGSMTMGDNHLSRLSIVLALTWSGDTCTVGQTRYINKDIDIATQTDIDTTIDSAAGVELTSTYEDDTLSIQLLNGNGQQLSKTDIAMSSSSPLHYTWDKSTDDTAKETFQAVFSAYKNGTLLDVDLEDNGKMYKLTNISQPTHIANEYWCQFRTVDWYTNGTDMVFLQTVNAVLDVNGSIVNSVSVKESNNQFALVREYDGTNGALPTNNTKEFVPQNDYEPATKRYVDLTHYQRISGWNSTKTQVLKNVNGTLTWVDEN